MRRIVLFLTVVWVCFASVALAETRVALVIGNSAYETAPPLANPVNDATAMAESLRRLGFAVVQLSDASAEGMRAGITEFARTARGSDLALFFYAGHGLQVDGSNYLLPVDASVQDETDLAFSTIELNDVLRVLTRSSRTTLVFLDACRDNPMATDLSRSMGTRSSAVGRGLAQVETGVGTLVTYATQPGNVALDGSGAHSPFAAALLQHIETPGLEIRQVVTRVREQVIAETSGQQVPWDNSSLTGDVILLPIAAEPQITTAPAPESAAGTTEDDPGDRVWKIIQFSDNPADFELFLQSFPDSPFAPYAQLRLAQLEPVAAESGSEQTTIVEPVPPEQAPAQETTATQAPDPAVEAEVAALPDVTAEIETDLAALEAGEAALSLNKDARTRVQLALTLLGHNTQGVDGAFGKNTRKAIGEYQVASAITTTGYLDQTTYDRLMADAAIPLQQWEAQEAARLAAEKEAAEKAAAEAAEAQVAPEVPADKDLAIVEEAAPAETQTAVASPTTELPWAGEWYGEGHMPTNGQKVIIHLVDGVLKKPDWSSGDGTSGPISLDRDGNLKATFYGGSYGGVYATITGTFPSFKVWREYYGSVKIVLSKQ